MLSLKKICIVKCYHPKELILQKPLYHHSCLHLVIYQECESYFLYFPFLLAIDSLSDSLLMLLLIVQQHLNCFLVSWPSIFPVLFFSPPKVVLEKRGEKLRLQAYHLSNISLSPLSIFFQPLCHRLVLICRTWNWVWIVEFPELV